MRRLLQLSLILPLTLGLSACELVGDILEIGFWAGIIVVALIIGLLWGLVRMLRGGRDRRPPPAP